MVSVNKTFRFLESDIWFYIDNGYLFAHDILDELTVSIGYMDMINEMVRDETTSFN
jgi:hypothetical protein